MRGTTSTEETARSWRQFKATGERKWRNVLMVHYFPIVKYNAERIGAKLPDEVDRDDLISAGVFGLIDAIKAFDLERGVKFETYCAPRIRGAILDELRSMDWVPRLVRSRSHKLDRVSRELESTFGRTPTDGEIADRLSISRVEFEKLRRAATAVVQPSLFEGWSTAVEDARALGKTLFLSDIPVHREQNPPRATYFDPESSEMLADGIEGAWATIPQSDQESRFEQARIEHRRHVIAFGRTFRELVCEAFSGSRSALTGHSNPSGGPRDLATQP
ncbi:MAG: hypothetical protein IIC51_09045 [Planctomycetes bacterium]|nr:hypothetical protein [Planctomycetota bacterium]